MTVASLSILPNKAIVASNCKWYFPKETSNTLALSGVEKSKKEKWMILREKKRPRLFLRE